MHLSAEERRRSPIMRTTKKRTPWQWVAVAGQLGFSIVTPIVLCTAAAYWLSERFSLGSWVVIPGIFLGLGGAAVSFLKVVRALQNDAEKQEDRDA